jgi:2'-5' RNA ligase
MMADWTVIYRGPMTRSALVVVVPGVEPVVDALRRRHDPMSGRGVPAHVTVLHPFRSVVDEETVAAVERLAGSLDAFTATFARVGQFPGSVVFLEPEPIHRFKDLTAAMVEAFPDCPPYGGAFTDPHPHLTVGNRVDEPTAQHIESVLSTSLPIAFLVDRLTLLVEDDDGHWTVDRSWPLRAQR